MLEINGERWRVLLVSPSFPLLNNHLGCCDDPTKAIYISEDLSPYKIKKVLCHEIVHAAMFSYNVDLNIDQEELLADLIATYGQEILDKTNIIFHRIREKREPY